MLKLLLLIILVTLSVKNFAQTATDKKISVKDSIEMMEDLMDILDDSKKSSNYFTAALGIGNRVFNVRNNILNAKITPVSTVVYSPSLVYFNKSGLYFSAGVNLLNDYAKGFGISQYSISTGYELPDNDKVDFTIAYTHFFVSDKFSPYVSPIQNDFYSAFIYKKLWIRPSLAVGYATGQYGDVKRIQILYDSTNNKLTVFSLIASASHEFEWGKVFNKKDALSFNTSILLNAGSSKIAIQHNTNAVNLLNFLDRKGRLSKFKYSKFQPESFGLSLDASYILGKFILEPQAYIDYYLPATDEKRVSGYFTFTIRYLL